MRGARWRRPPRMADAGTAAPAIQWRIERRLVDRVELPDCGAACYALSEAGRDTLRRGERWWREMNPFERLLVEFTG